MTSDKIVFSKRSLLEFFRYVKSGGTDNGLTDRACQMTVNTNFTEISKLPSKSVQAMQSSLLTTPEYATFGKLSQAATDAAVADLVDVSHTLRYYVKLTY
jgi:hypothetical protein